MSVRRSLLVLTFLIVLLPAVMFTIRSRFAVQDAPTRNLQLYTLEYGRVEVAVTAIGAIEADQVVRLAFTTPGRIRDVFVQQGDYVLAGDVLLQQANDTQRLSYDQALLARDLAYLQRARLYEPVDPSQIRIAEAAVNSALGAYTAIQNAVTDDDIRAAELRYEQAQQAYEAAQLARSTAPGGQSEQAYQLLDAQTGQASFGAEIARLQLDSLRGANSGQSGAAYMRVVQAQRELERVQAGPTQATFDQAEVVVQQAENGLTQAESAYNRTILSAPFDGVVSTLNAEVGSLVAPGFNVIELTDISPLRLRVQVDEVDIRSLNESMAARVQLDALPGVSLPANVEQIALVGTNDGGIVSYDVQMHFEGDDPRVRVGMTAEAAIIVEAKDDVLVVPNLYVRIDRVSGKTYVNVLRADDTLEEIEITLGLRGQDTSEVIAGLREGDVIAFDLSGSGFSFLAR